ncbi:unnamed protein product [Caenorhabditis auriculariae]|uniref:Phospholipase B1, membrane-associated n=1 Tax=Caenorhabditis auriculariae TaxID=2777116 RepID=A0A8S1HA73_9PELO|nr:unnamed protein product [Caenorhabditis auriculariae]
MTWLIFFGLLVASRPILAIVGGVPVKIFDPDQLGIVKSLAEFEQWKTLRNSHLEQFEDYPLGWPSFGCERPKRPTARSVHRLTPGDIEIIAALGDSLTVGQAALSTSLSDIGSLFTGINFATGTARSLDHTASLANILQYYNQNLIGGSSKLKNHGNAGIGMNFAKSGATALDLPRQAKELVKYISGIKNNDRKWKFVNVFIGSNDLCSVCLNETLFGSENYGRTLLKSLNILRSGIKRLFVNVMPAFNVDVIRRTHNISDFCQTIHRVACPCLFEMSSAELRAKKQEQFAEMLKIVSSFPNNDDDFAVVVSPALETDKLPTLPDSTLPNTAFLALDCFHFFHVAHDVVAKQIWKGLFEPVGAKSITDFSQLQPALWDCPPPNCPYFATANNTELCKKALYRPPSLPEQRFRLSETRLLVKSPKAQNQTVIPWIILSIVAMIGVTSAFVVTTVFRRRMRDGEMQPLLVRMDIRDHIF